MKKGIDDMVATIKESVLGLISVLPQWLQDWIKGTLPTIPPIPPTEPIQGEPDVTETQAYGAMGGLTESLNSLNRTILMTTLPSQQNVSQPVGANTLSNTYNFNLTTRDSTAVIRRGA